VAENSKRERILVKVVALVDGIAAINYTTREQPADPKELTNYPVTRFPMAAITGGLPVPVERDSQRPGGQLMKAVSNMGIDIVVYGQYGVTGAGAQNPDTIISNLADELWRVLQAEPTLGFKWVLGLDISPQPVKAVFRPYFAFSFTATITYVHDKGGI